MRHNTTFAIVASENVDIYIESQGRNGYAIETCDTLTEARERAAEIADDYHYGVEIVNTADWRMI